MLVLAAAASAQTVIDPNFAEFDPSADHSATGADGSPRVSFYTLTIFQAGTTTPLQTLNVGKPAPDLDGKIRVAFVSLL